VGRDSGSPVLEGSLVYALPGVLSGPIQHGIWGLYGREDFDELDASFDQWGVGGHMVLPLTAWATLVGEVQYGRNLVWGANVKQTVYKHIVMGLEFQRFDTSFLVEGSHQANLIWLSGILNF